MLLSGHSGGPVLSAIGEVVGWAVRSQMDRIVSNSGAHGSQSHLHPSLAELRPINLSIGELAAVMQTTRRGGGMARAPSSGSSATADEGDGGSGDGSGGERGPNPIAEDDVRNLLRGILPAGSCAVAPCSNLRIQTPCTNEAWGACSARATRRQPLPIPHLPPPPPLPPP